MTTITACACSNLLAVPVTVASSNGLVAALSRSALDLFALQSGMGAPDRGRVQSRGLRGSSVPEWRAFSQQS